MFTKYCVNSSCQNINNTIGFFALSLSSPSRFDDIYLGIVSLKANIEPLHSEEFYFYKANYVGPQSYRYLIASHGYDDPMEMLRVWTELKASGHA